MKINNVYVLDCGNTAIKVAQFKGGVLSSVSRMTTNECLNFDWKKKIMVLANVADSEFCTTLKANGAEIIEINTCFISSFKTAYSSMNTLGIDRFCNVEGMAISGQKGNLLCIDIGTCVKFDLLDCNKVYQGGSISPGIDLRFKSLHDNTARLPLEEKVAFKSLVGNSTKEAILSGVMMGVQAEIQKRIDWYQSEYADLTIFVTGGDASYFDFPQKSNIFADENLTLKGIYSIYSNNAL